MPYETAIIIGALQGSFASFNFFSLSKTTLREGKKIYVYLWREPMKRDFSKECGGCCFWKRAGVIEFICIFKECPFHQYFFGDLTRDLNTNKTILETCFT